MAVIVTFEVQAKPEQRDALRAFMRRILPDTRAYQGCQGLDLLVDQDAPERLVVLETWESRAHYERYLAWREESGTVAEVGPMLAAPPTVRYFDLDRAWP